jgi:hypothetical protein
MADRFVEADDDVSVSQDAEQIHKDCLALSLSCHSKLAAKPYKLSGSF